jgi:hypothetical protein
MGQQRKWFADGKVLLFRFFRPTNERSGLISVGSADGEASG